MRSELKSNGSWWSGKTEKVAPRCRFQERTPRWFVGHSVRISSVPIGYVAAAIGQPTRLVTRWHASFNLPTATAEPNRITTDGYDARGNLTSEKVQPTTDAVGRERFGAGASNAHIEQRTLTYGQRNLLSKIRTTDTKTGLSSLIEFGWAPFGAIESISDRSKNQTLKVESRHLSGLPASILANSLRINTRLDQRGRLVELSDSTGSTKFVWRGQQIVTVTPPNGEETKFIRTTEGHIVAISHAGQMIGEAPQKNRESSKFYSCVRQVVQIGDWMSG
jgi:hypothetical protein